MPHLDAQAISRRIAEIRRKLRLTQGAFARRLGLSKRTIVYYEAGRIPDWEELCAIAEAGSKSIEWILMGEEHPPEVPREAKLLLREAPVVYQSLVEDLKGDRRLLQAVRGLIDVMKGNNMEEIEALLVNIEVFADRARARLRRRRGNKKAAG